MTHSVTPSQPPLDWAAVLCQSGVYYVEQRMNRSFRCGMTIFNQSRRRVRLRWCSLTHSLTHSMLAHDDFRIHMTFTWLSHCPWVPSTKQFDVFSAKPCPCPLCKRVKFVFRQFNTSKHELKRNWKGIIDIIQFNTSLERRVFLCLVTPKERWVPAPKT